LPSRVDYDNHVDMVWHDDKFIDGKVRISCGEGDDFFFDDTADGGWAARAEPLPYEYFGKYALTVMRADGDEICAVLAVIIIL